MKAFVAAAALLLLSCGESDTRAPDISVTNGWTREIAPGQSAAAAYVMIANRGDGEDRLLGVAAPLATAATLHSSSSEGGIARMRPVEGGIEIRPRATVELKPGGTHVMLTGLKRPLRAGQAIDATLRFENSGDRAVMINVVPAGAADNHAHRMGM